MSLLVLIVLLFGVASLAIESVESELATSIKNFLRLTPDNKILKGLSKWSYYYGMLGWWVYVLFFITIPTYLFFNCLFLFIRMWDCCFCLSFWYGTAFSLFYLQHDVFISAVIGGVTVLITRIIDKFVTF